MPNNVDNATGISWPVSGLAAGASQTFSFQTEIVDTVPAGGFSFAGPAGSTVGGTVATITDPNTSATPSAYSATINWGDGSSSAGTVGGGNGSFSVTGNHSYVAGGTYPITVTITAVGTNQGSSTVSDSATITAAPSTVITGVPTVSSSTKAGFAGSVNPEGLPTTTHFEYGLDSRYSTPGTSGPVYDHSTPSQSVGSDFSSHSVSASVSGLVPNALYHVRLVATNAAGTTNGPDMTFKTDRGPVPGAPALGKTFNVSSTGLVLIKVHGVFIPLTELTKIPNGTIINALHGTLSLTTALPAVQHAVIAAKKKAKKPKIKTQKGQFRGAVFKVTQARSGLATLALVEGAKFKGAPTYAGCKTKKGKAVTAALIQEDAAAAARQRPRQVPLQGPLRRSDRPRHDLDDRRPLRRNTDPRDQGHRHRQRLRPPQDNHPAARPQLSGTRETAAQAKITTQDDEKRIGAHVRGQPRRCYGEPGNQPGLTNFRRQADGT